MFPQTGCAHHQLGGNYHCRDRLVADLPHQVLHEQAGTGIREIYQTQDAIRWNASHDERYQLRIPARALDPTR